MTKGKTSCGTTGQFKIIFSRGKDNKVLSGIKEMTFLGINNLILSGQLQIPDFQRVLDNDIVDNMITSFKIDNSLIKEVGYLFFGVLENKPFVIDGQHRIEMIRRLVNEDNKYGDEIIAVNFKTCNAIKDLEKVYEVLNKDKTKIAIPIEIKYNFDGMIYENLRKLFKQPDYKHYFASNRSNSYRYFLDDYMKLLYENNAVQKLNISNANDFFNKLLNINKNLDYYNKFDKNHLDNLFYKDEIKLIEQKMFLMLKRSNIIENILNGDVYYHPPKTIKKKIPKKLRIKIWYNFTELENIKCPITFCSEIINKENFHAGHIISEYNGGEVIEANLKPICKGCNLSMGSKNWVDYDRSSATGNLS